MTAPREPASTDEPEAPRVRDMPAPREATGLAAKPMRWVFTWPYRAILAGLLRIGARPWHLTVLALLTGIVMGGFLLRGRFLVAGLLLILSGILDVFDGAVARQRGEERRSGAFLDSVFDRISDAILFGCLYWAVSGQGKEFEAGLALVTLASALTVSHLRAEAEADGVSLTEGYFQRLERMFAMMVGLCIPRTLLPALAILTVLGGVTVLQRAWSAITRVGALEGGER
jgi:phosphatidylglycerophosphate synthase